MFLLVLSTLISGISAFKTSGNTEEKIVRVQISDGKEISELNRFDMDILERYESFVLIEADEKTIEKIDSTGMDVNDLPNRDQITVKGHNFDIDQGPALDSDLTIEGYEEGTEGLYVVHTLGPVHPEWRNTLEENGVDIINYVPNYAYEVSMTPSEADDLRSLDFVDWVGVYQPAYKLDSDIENFIYSNSPNLEKFIESKSPQEDMVDPEEVLGGIDISLRSRDDKRSLYNIKNEILSEQHRIVSSVDKEDGFHRLTVSIDSMMEMKRTELKNLFQRIAHEKDVYYISPNLKPQLHGEMDSQIIGGGAWFMDDEEETNTTLDPEPREGDPSDPYRKYQDYGAYINQLGYDGEGVTIAIADTGMGDGTVGDAGHPDLKGRVVGGYGFGDDPDYWRDVHGHGTHTTGSAAADGYHGTGETFEFGNYTKAQGLAYESELFSAKIFDDEGNFLASDDYYSIVEEPAQQSHAYIHSNSWGSSSRGAYEESDEIFDQAVRDADRDSAENRPMVITASAGNDGARGETTTGSPGNAKNIITVGATQTYNPPDGFENAENIAGFSSRGWTEDSRVKPDVTAPGEGIYSLTPPSIEEEGYQTMSGTSMSNPAVAGAASVVVDWYRENYGERPSPAMVKSILINTANDLNENISNTRGPVPNQDEGWGSVDLSKLQYPMEESTPFTFQDQNTLLQTGEEQEYVIAPDDNSKSLNITLTWTDKNALEGDSENGARVLKNDLDLEVITPDGETYRGNAFNKTGGTQSDTGYTFPGTEAMSIFDNNTDGWDNVNTVENVYLPPEKVEAGAYTVRVIGRDIPADANNDGTANQDFALTCHNTRMPSDGVIYTDSKRYAGEDTVELTAVDWDLQDQSSYSEVGISSDSDPSGFNVTLTGATDSQELTVEVDISQNSTSGDVLEVSDGDYITAKYWDEDIGDGSGKMKSYKAYVDAANPEPAQRFNVDWWSPHRIPVWEDNVTDGSDYTNGTSHENASTWAMRSHDSVIGTNSWDWGDGWFNKSADEGMKSWLTSPGIDVPEEDPRQMGIEFTFQHWRDFGDPLLYDGGNLKMSTQGPNGPYEIIEPEGGYDGKVLENHDNPLGGQPAWGGEVGWETATFDLSDYNGETVHFRWEAGTEAWHDQDDDHLQGEGWRIDQLALNEIVQGTDHNRLTWTASPNDKDVAWDDPTGHLAQYNIYRSSDKSGPWDSSNLLDTVRADRSDRYVYTDTDAGEEDTTRWWYVIRGEKDVGNEEMNEITVAEPGGPSLLIDSPGEGDIFTDDEVTVEWTGSTNISSYEIRLDEKTPIDKGSSTQHTFTGLSEGSHKVSVTGFTADEVAYEDVKFMVDMTSPQLDILSPGDGTYVNESEVMIEWDGSDDISGIDHYEVRVDGSSWTDVGEDTFYLLSGDGHNETYQVEIRAHDKASFTTTSMTNFTLDLMDPLVNIQFPMKNGWAGEDMTAEWYGLDEVSSLDHYSVRIPEDSRYQHWIDVGTDTEHEFLGLEGGEEYTLQLIATDNAGNYNMTSSKFSVDPEPPHVDILYPSLENETDENETDEYPIIGKNDVDVVWSRADQYSGLSHIDVKLDNESWTEDIGVPSSYTFSDLSDGLHTVKVRVTNNARLQTNDTVTFMVDTSPPSLEITSPDQKSTYTTDNVTVEWEGSDDYSGIEGYAVRLNQESWIDAGLETQYTFEDLEAKEHYVEVRAKNNAGYSKTKSVTFTVDPANPIVNILSPDQDELFADDEVTVKWEGRDERSGIDHYEVRLNEDTWENVGSSQLYTFKSLVDGENSVEVRAYDIAGNQETTGITFTVDTTAPELDIISPEQNKIYDKESITATWSGNDETSGIVSYEVRLNQGDWIEVDGTEYVIENLEDDHYILKVRGTDEAGYSSVEEIGFTVDTTSPVLSIDTPESNQIYDKDTILVRWSGTDDTSGISYYQVKLGEDDWIDVGKETEHEFSSVEDGEPTITVRAEDEAGNSNEDEVQFIVDTELGELNIDYPAMDQELPATMFPSSRSVPVEWSGESSPTDIVNYKVRINEGSWIELSENITHYTFEEVPEGEHQVEVQAIDEAGNIKIDTVQFTVDIELGELNIDQPEVDQELQADIFSSSRSVTVDWSGEAYPADNVTYKVRIDRGPWIDVGSDTTEYTFEDVSEGEHTVEIRAEYAEGNDEYELTEEVNFEVSPGFVAAYWWLLVLIAVIITSALAFILRRRKKEEEETPGPEEEPGGNELGEEGWEEEEMLYGGSGEDEAPPSSEAPSEEPLEGEEEIFEDEQLEDEEEEIFDNDQPNDEEESPPPPPPESSESAEDILGDLEDLEEE